MRISVIIAAYNAEAFLGETLESVLAQTRPPEEVIVSDDASMDRTREVVRSFGARVTLIENTENKGPGARRNQAAARATGDAIALLDADNRWEPDHLDTVGGLLDRFPEAGVAISRMRVFGTHEEIWPGALPCADAPTQVMLPLLRHNFVELSSLLIRRPLFERVGGFVSLDEKYKGRWVLADDYYLSLRLSLETLFVGSMKPTVWYRRHEGQSSHFRAPLVRQAFAFRLRILDQINQDPRHAPMLPAAEDRVRLAWEEECDAAWRKRDTEALRMMIRFGLKRERIRDISATYRWKMLLPKSFLRLYDHK